MSLINVIANILSFISVLLAVIALYSASRQHTEMKRQIIKLDDQLKQLDDIRRALTTRFIGRFPDYFPQAVMMIERAEKEIVVVCEYPGIGIFTTPPANLRFRQALVRKQMENIPIQITFLNSKWRRKVAEEQFSKTGDDWEEWKKGNRTLVTQFLKNYSKGISAEQLSRQDLLEILSMLDAKILSQEFDNIPYIEIDTSIPMHWFLIDGKEAIFSIASYKHRIDATGFLTSDQTIISALMEMSDRYHRSYVE